MEDMRKYMDEIPTVVNCCFCWFLRAGSLLIAVASFIVGAALAPNVDVKHGYWVITPANLPAQIVQKTMGIFSILLCIVSVLLVIGALLNFPRLLEYYQWGVVLHSSTIVLTYFASATHCFCLYDDCLTRYIVIFIFMAVYMLVAAYFVIVVNSLRLSMLYLANSTILDV